MSSSQQTVSRAVQEWMTSRGVTQETLALALGVRQQSLSSKLRGRRRWSLDDLDRLAAHGVPVGVAITMEVL